MRGIALVFGPRHWPERDFVIWRKLDELKYFRRIDVVMHGDSPYDDSVDRIAGAWAVARGLQEWKRPADWAKFGNTAGPIRNKAMHQELNALEGFNVKLGIQFPFGGKGTLGMRKLLETRKSKAAGVEVIEVRL